MPFGDGTGPAGLGPMTGRAAGFCAGFAVPGCANPIPGRGFGGRGRGRGRGGGGRGRRNWYYATGLPGWMRAGYGWPAWGETPYAAPYAAAAAAPFAGPFVPRMTPQQEAEALKAQADYLAETLESIKKRIEELAQAPAAD